MNDKNYSYILDSLNDLGLTEEEIVMALEDGEALAGLGIGDEHQEDVEELHFLLTSKKGEAQ